MLIYRSLARVLIPILVGGCSRATSPIPFASGKAGFRQLAPVLIAADRFELLSLDPMKGEERLDSTEPGRFRGWAVLGKTVVSDRPTRTRLIDALQRGVDSGAQAARCFDPRHALHIAHDGKTVDLLICFECSQVKVIGDHLGTLTTDRTPEPVLDEILKKAGVPLAPK